MHSSATTWIARLGLIVLAARASAQTGGLRGRVVDQSSSPLPGATVRVLSTPAAGVVAVGKSDADGVFRLSGIPTGKYSLDVGLGLVFRARLIRSVEVTTEVAGLGDVRLDLAGCDMPGISCDSVSGADEPTAPPAPPAAFEMLRLGQSLAVCGKKAVGLRRIANRLEFQPVGKAEITPLDPDARRLDYGKTPIIIEGLGPGHDFWIRRDGCPQSHVVLASEPAPSLSEIRVWRIGIP